MLELLRKYVDSLAGVTEMPRDRAEQLVRDLQKRGETRIQDVQRAVQDVMKRSSRNRQELLRLVRKEIKSQLSSVGVATRDDLERLARRVDAIEGGAAGTSAGSDSASTTAKPRAPRAPRTPKASPGRPSGAT